MTTNEIKNYSWGEYDFSQQNIEVLDTSLRDGLQDSLIRHPDLDEKLEFIRRLSAVGIEAVDIAIPVARGPHLKDAIQLAKRLPSNITIACLARTHEIDIKAALALAEGAGRQVEGIIFVGASPLRRFVEGWELEYMTKWMAENVALAAKEGIIPVVATEHTTESEPDVIRQLYRAGLENGGKKVCIADTTGAGTEKGVRRLIKFFQDEVLQGFGDIPIDWHGHNDRDLAVANSLVALDAGAKRVHVSVLEIGERAGNTQIEAILTNLKIGGDPKRQDLTKLLDLSTYASEIFNVAIRPNYPAIGEKVGLTASGIHAAAMNKARGLGMEAGSPYSIVDQRWFGRESGVRIGPLSGEANVREVAGRLGLNATPQLIETVLEYAVRQNKILTDLEVRNICRSLDGNGHHGNS